MNTRQHPHGELLGASVLGILDPVEQAELEEHVATCEDCRVELAELRETEASLADVPPEAFLEGPPAGGDLLLQRTLRQVREEQAALWRRRSFRIGLSAAASAAVLFLGGFLVAGHDSSSDVADPPAASASPTQPGTRVASATDVATKAHITVRVTPAAGWVRLHAEVAGVPTGERCRLVVLSENGERQTAGSWVVPPSGKTKGKGTSLDGSAAIAPDQVKSVTVENEQGKRYVSVPL
ncbi:zf-HC2 domain-containing protein [Streptomyces flaveolus]|uniref:zf-HC2 domain-containing protein n=1 Tax=Streptomyces flaveolus TaxID=67297 RepID=UPI0034106976